MESTKARYIEMITRMYNGVVPVFPESEQGYFKLAEGEEVEGVLCMFFTNKSSRGFGVGVIHVAEMADYMAELAVARTIAIEKGEEIVSKESIKTAFEATRTDEPCPHCKQKEKKV